MIGHFFETFGLLLVINVARHSTWGYSIADIQDIKKTLIEDRAYDNSIRPVLNQSYAVEIQIAFAVTSIVDFDLVSGRIAITGYIFTSWTDEQLLWNPLTFNGIQSFLLSKSLIWTPDLRNAFDFDDAFAVSRVTVFANGRITWMPASVFYSICKVDITYYPYDEHTCQFPIFSNNDDDTTLRFVPISKTINMENFNVHGVWEVTSTVAEVVTVSDVHIANVRVSSFIATLTLRRRPRFALLHTYFPLLILYVVNTLTFLVPLNNGERMSFSITLLLALIFFTASTSVAFPQTSLNTSYFSTTMTLTVCASSISVMISAILVGLGQETERPVPRLLRLLASGYKRWKKDGRCFHGNRNVVMTFKEPTEDAMEGDGCKPDFPVSDKAGDEGAEATRPITWSDVAEALNVVVFWIYTLLLLISVIVLVGLHHLR